MRSMQPRAARTPRRLKALAATATVCGVVVLCAAPPAVATEKNAGQGRQASVIGSVSGGASVDNARRTVEVTYTGSDPSVATVDSRGLVTVVGTGRTVITARATIGGHRVVSNPVTVSVSPPPQASPSATSPSSRRPPSP
ncbi:Alpha-1,3-galactosidase A [Streptomyces sp. ADI92-24]|nr:Ig-like protein group 2 [Streptomyces sp. CEV 2-1]RPK34289.1 Alpha-1,3-galactosidase A [Streptomyces sp. ADI92-24]